MVGKAGKSDTCMSIPNTSNHSSTTNHYSHLLEEKIHVDNCLFSTKRLYDLFSPKDTKSGEKRSVIWGFYRGLKIKILFNRCIIIFCLPDLFSGCIISIKVKYFTHLYFQINKTIQRKIVNIFLSISFNICFGCSKEASH